jgi:hypothetical protein
MCQSDNGRVDAHKALDPGRQRALLRQSAGRRREQKQKSEFG